MHLAIGKGDNLNDRMTELETQYLAMAHAFAEADNSDISPYTTQQKNLEIQVKEFRLQQERQRRSTEHQHLVTLWHQEMDVMFDKVDQMNSRIAELVLDTQKSLVPPSNASTILDELQQTVIQVPVPDDRIRHWIVQDVVGAPKDTLVMMDQRVHSLQQRKMDLVDSILHARLVTDQCSLMQQLMTEMDDLVNVNDLDTLVHSIEKMATRIHDPVLHVSPNNDNDDETNTRVRQALDTKLVALKERRDALDASIRHNTWRSECNHQAR